MNKEVKNHFNYWWKELPSSPHWRWFIEWQSFDIGVSVMWIKYGPFRFTDTEHAFRMQLLFFIIQIETCHPFRKYK